MAIDHELKALVVDVKWVKAMKSFGRGGHGREKG